MSMKFVHLNVHTEYSMIDSIVRLKPCMEQVIAGGMAALAITDYMNLYCVVKFFKAATAMGIKPILGADLLIKNPQDPGQPWLLTVLCQDDVGYHNLKCLVSRGYVEGQELGVPLLEKAWLDKESVAGLIALSGAQQGDVGTALAAGNQQQAESYLQDWLELFPQRFYMELQRLKMPQEELYIQAALSLAEKFNAPVVATNKVRFLESKDFMVHEARVCINQGRMLSDNNRPRSYTADQYLRSADEMCRLFADIPSALQNTVEIAKRCNVTLVLGNNYLPDFPVPAGTTIADYFSCLAQQGLELRLKTLFDSQAADFAEQRKPYDERLSTELKVINSMGFAGYFLIVADFIGWAKQQHIPVGPGRGSGAGSLVAYALNITDLDPLKYELLFERFLNPERVSMPDFDIDFCTDGRDRVIEYVTEKYGRESVSQIITFGSMAAKAVVRDVGRALGHPYGFVDKIAKLIPFELGITLDKALAQEEVLRQRYQEEEEVQTLLDLARALEGITRNAGKHAGGVVIAPGKLTDFTPLYCEERGANLVAQFDKDDVEAIGLVKFDFLGLRNLTIIDWALQIINQRRQAKQLTPLDIQLIPTDDKASFDLLKACHTMAIFQLESRGMKDLVKRLLPDCFEEIIALVALFRPGPLQSGMVDDFIDRKHGRTKVEYPHPALEHILKPTYGVILYQEQVMQIAQVLANYSLGSADLLRRAMGKRKPEEMAEQREVFVNGAIGQGVEKKTAIYIFDLMEKFAGYGFNKSHSAAYALVSYQTAYIKTHYPLEFMAAALSSDMDNTDRIVLLLEDCKLLNLIYTPPNVNKGFYKFTVAEDDTLNYGLGAIKGVGQQAIEGIVEEREKNGPYQNFFEFCQRVDLKKVNRRTLEALIRSGAFDDFKIHRASLLASLEVAIQQAEQQARNASTGQDDLFADDVQTLSQNATLNYVDAAVWTDRERLAGEKDTLGVYLTGHPLHAYQEELAALISTNIASLRANENKTMTLAGLIIAVRTMQTKRGDRMAFITLDDCSGRVELAVFPETYNTHRELLQKDNIVIVEGEVAKDKFSGEYRMSAKQFYGMQQARETFSRDVWLKVSQTACEQGIVEKLSNLLAGHRPGRCPVIIQYHTTEAQTDLLLSEQWRVTPSDGLLETLQQMMGKENVKVRYR